MNYKTLGNSDCQISEIGFGCMSLGSNDSNNKVLLHRAFENGINFFDTADLYNKGQNEQTIGKAFKKLRQNIILATKVGNEWHDDSKSWRWNPTKEYILAAVDRSLKRLQTDYIDLYQLHGGTIEDPIDETIETFELLKQQGKIRYYGISSIRPNVIREYCKRANIVSVMMQYNLLDRRPEESCFALLEKNNISVLARGPLAKGLLVDKPATSYLDYNLEVIKSAQSAIKEVSGEKRSSAQSSLNYVLNNNAVTSAVPGIRTMKQLLDCLGACRTEKLSTKDIIILENSLKKTRYNNHR